jgi:hypothetical protein
MFSPPHKYPKIAPVRILPKMLKFLKNKKIADRAGVVAQQ